MRHVAPHQWAASARGELTEAQDATFARHAERCQRCAAVRERVIAARGVFDDICKAEPAALPWDHIGARVYWANSSARHGSARHGSARHGSARHGSARHRRGSHRPRIRPLFIMGGTAVAAAAVAAGWFMTQGGGDGRPAVQRGAELANSPTRTEAALPTLASLPAAAAAPELSGVTVFAAGDVQVSGAPLAFDAVIGAGATIDTKSGQVTVQFAHASGFTAGPRTQIDIRAFDTKHVDLVVRGDIFVDVSPSESRKAQRRVRIFAGDRVVEVKGTAFHVGHRDGKLDVSCSRGRVVVKSARHEVSVGAGHRLRIGDQEPVGALTAHAISADYRKTLETQTRLPMLPVWVGAKELFRASSTLRIAGPAATAVRVDGIAVSHGTFAMRVMSGRHHVERAGLDGAWNSGAWVDVSAGQTTVAETSGSTGPLRGATRPAATRSTGPGSKGPVGGKASARRKRTAELDRAMRSSGRINRCMMPLRKQGLASGSFIVLDIGITATGNVDHLNIVKSNLPKQTARCMRDAVDTITFARGPAAAVRHRLSF